MSFFASVWRAVSVASSVTEAVAAGRVELDAGRGPLAALRAFAVKTDGQLDDTAVAELEAGMRKAIAGLAIVTSMAATVAQTLRDPAVRRGIDQVLDGAIDVGYACSHWKNQLRLWLDEGGPSP